MTVSFRMFLSTWEEFTRAAEKLQGESFFTKNHNDLSKMGWNTELLKSTVRWQMSNNLQIPSLWPKSEFLNWFWHIFMVCSVGNNIHRRSTSITICCRILKWCQTFRKIFNFKNALVLWLCWWIIVFSDTSVRQFLI